MIEYALISLSQFIGRCAVSIPTETLQKATGFPVAKDEFLSSIGATEHPAVWVSARQTGEMIANLGFTVTTFHLHGDHWFQKSEYLPQSHTWRTVKQHQGNVAQSHTLRTRAQP